MNILVLGIGGNVSQGILRTIRKSDISCKIVGACVSRTAIGFNMCNKSYISPYANSKDFVPWLIRLCNKEKIDLILTGVEEIIETIAVSSELLVSNTFAIFISSPPPLLKIGNDKLLTVQWLKDNGCNYPPYADLSQKAQVNDLIKQEGFPLIAKPRRGKGSDGLFIINNQEELNKVYDLSDYVLQKLMGNEDSEYTVACYYDKNSKFKEMIIMKRKLENGTTVEAETVFDKAIYDECKKICEAFNPRGPLNIQLRMDNLKPFCFELNVRFSGTTPIRSLLGYNDLIALIREYILDLPIDDCFRVKQGKVIRNTTETLVKHALISEV